MLAYRIIVLLFLVAAHAVAQDMQALKVPINSPMGNESNPSLTGNGRTLLYEAPIGDYDRKLIAISYQRGGVWSKPEAVPGVSQKAEKVFTGGHFISFEGNYIFFSSGRYGGIGSNDLYYLEKAGDGWRSPVNLGKPINSTSSENDPALSPDGKYLYFVRYTDKKTATGKPCGKIFVAERKGKDAYLDPKELPSPINSGCECNPRPLADNSFTFASERTGGKGGYDQYKTSMNDNGSWSTPMPLNFINTKEDELYISIPAGGDFLYMTGKGKASTDIVRTIIPESLQAKNVAALTGSVKDAKTNTPLIGKILVKKIHQGTQKYIGTIEGNYATFLPEKEIYLLSISSKGYSFQTDIYNLDTLNSFKEVRNDIKLIPLHKNNRFTIIDLLFEADHTIAKSSEFTLDAMARMMQENLTLQIQVERHIDASQVHTTISGNLENLSDTSAAVGLDSLKMLSDNPINMTLHEADAVKLYLIQKGISGERIICQGYGDTRPCNLAPALSVKCNNNRIEILVVKE